MADDRDDLIRSRAYELWEAEGSPHGRHDDHWTQATREVGEAQDEAAAASTGPASAPAEAPAALPDETTPVAEPQAAPAKRARKPAAPSAPTAKGRRKKDG